MRKKDNQASEAGDVQVFELTMDNPEDQDELNRRPGGMPTVLRGHATRPFCRGGMDGLQFDGAERAGVAFVLT